MFRSLRVLDTDASVAAGAELVLDESHFQGAKEGTTLVGPQVLVNVDHSEFRRRHCSLLSYAKLMIAMEVMKEETFGPVVGIMKVENDEEALTLMNDSPYGLVRSVSDISSQLTTRPHRYGHRRLPQHH